MGRLRVILKLAKIAIAVDKIEPMVLPVGVPCVYLQLAATYTGEGHAPLIETKQLVLAEGDTLNVRSIKETP